MWACCYIILCCYFCCTSRKTLSPRPNSLRICCCSLTTCTSTRATCFINLARKNLPDGNHLHCCLATSNWRTSLDCPSTNSTALPNFVLHCVVLLLSLLSFTATTVELWGDTLGLSTLTEQLVESIIINV